MYIYLSTVFLLLFSYTYFVLYNQIIAQPLHAIHSHSAQECTHEAVHVLYTYAHRHQSPHVCSPSMAAQHRSAPSSVPPMSQECGNDCLNFIKRTASFGSIFTNTIKKKQL